jgi:hypothetical protein
VPGIKQALLAEVIDEAIGVLLFVSPLGFVEVGASVTEVGVDPLVLGTLGELPTGGGGAAPSASCLKPP